MIEEQVVVTAIDGETIKVGGYQKPSCGGCAQKTSCGTSALGQLLGNKEVEIEVQSDLSLASGDQVLIGIEESAMLWGAFRVYIIPLLLFFLFGMAGELISELLGYKETELISLFFALFGLAVGFLALKKSFLGRFGSRQLKPIIIRKL